MNWNTGGWKPVINLEGIKRLVVTEGVTLEQVLCDASLSRALSYEQEDVVGFLTKPEIMTQLLDWSLTTKMVQEQYFMRYSKLATGVLTAACHDFQKELTEFKEFPAYLENFFSTNAIDYPILCGHFQRILEHAIGFTRGEILQSLPNLVEDLCDHLDILAAKVLLTHLGCKLRQYEVSIDDIFSNIATAIAGKGRKAYNALSVLKQIMKEDDDVLCQVDLSAMIRAILTLCVDPEEPDLYRTEGLVVLGMIISIFEDDAFTSILDEFEDQFDFDSTTGNVSVAIFRVYRNRLAQAFTRFMENPTNSFLGRTVLLRLREMEADELEEFVQSNDIVEQLVSHYSVDQKCSGHMTEIALLIDELESVHDDNAWLDFKHDVLKGKIGWIENCKGYGGATKSYEDPYAEEDAVVHQRPGTPRVSDYNCDSDSDEENEEEEILNEEEEEDIYANAEMEEEENNDKEEEEEEEEETEEERRRREIYSSYGL